MPTNPLTLEHCRNLAKWGMEQELKEGDWIWRTCRWPNEIEIPPKRELLTSDDNSTRWVELHGVYRIPDLAELMEFAHRVGYWELTPIENGYHLQYDPTDHDQFDWWAGGDPRQLFYKLIEKHFEVKHED